jgi:hypothetical protein
MSKSIFISYVYEDKLWRDKLKDWASKQLLGANIQISHERGDYRQKGEGAVKEEIKSMIHGASAVIFLIGQNSHNHPWIDYEASCTIGKNKKILLLRLPNTTGGPPKALTGHSEILFDVNKIKNALV